MAVLSDIKNMGIPSENSCLADVTGDSEGISFCLLFLSVIWPRVIWKRGGGKEEACWWTWITDLLYLNPVMMVGRRRFVAYRSKIVIKLRLAFT
jgi:hypothetical protein